MTIEIVDWDKHYENNRTRELKKMQWVPMPIRHDGAGYRQLIDHPNGAAHFGAWCALVEVAASCEVRGTLSRNSATPLSEADLARMTGIPEKIWQEALPRLVSIGWIKNNENPAGTCDAGPHLVAMNRMEWNGMEGMEDKTVSTPVAPTLRTKSAPLIFYDFSESLWHGISDEQVALWGEAYPAVDVDLELRQIGEWCKSNGARGKKQNWKRFIVNWLKRSQDKGGSQPKGVKSWKR